MRLFREIDVDNHAVMNAGPKVEQGEGSIHR